MRGWAAIAATASLIAAGCGGGGGHELSVELRTDLVPGVEFASVRTTLAGEDDTSRGVARGQDFVRGVRVAEYDGLASGVHSVRVALLDGGGDEVAARVVRVRIEADFGLVVLVTRDCRGVACPLPDGDPTLEACLGGRCVHPDCLDGDPTACGEPECETSGGCPPVADCAIARCEEGACLAIGDDAQCEDGQWCNPEDGCTALPEGPADGGVDGGRRDAGPAVDAGRPPPPPDRTTCEACSGAAQCVGDADCVPFDESSACVPRCDPGAASCPVGFECDDAAGLCRPTSGRCCVDADTDGFGAGVGCAGPDCDDGRAEAHPGADELCNGLEDDCDEAVDEGCVCAAGETQPCGSDVGLCAPGIQTCRADGTWGPCTGAVLPTGEVCNGEDDDCDGSPDDGACLTCLPAGWTREILATVGDTGRETAVAADAAGGVHVSFWDRAGNGLAYAYHGPSGYWVPETVDGAGDVGEHSSIAVDEDGNLHVVHYDTRNDNLSYAFRAPEGAWELAIVDAPGNVGQYADIAIDSVGVAHAVWYDASNTALRYGTRPPGGLWTAETVDAPDNVGLYAAIAVGPDDALHVVYRDATHTDLKYATRSPGGPWNITTVDADGNVGNHGDVVVDAAGAVHVAYQHAGDADLRYGVLEAGTWTLETVDAPGSQGQYAQVAVTDDGTVHLLYRDGSTTDLAHASRAPGGGAWTLETVDDAGDVGHHVRAAADGDVIRVAYFDNSRDDLRLASLVDGAWHIEVVDAPGDVGRYAGIAIDEGGTVHVSYEDNTHRDLRVACRQAMDGWRTELVDTTGNVGRDSSITVSPDGTVRIAYRDDTNDDLKLAEGRAGAWSVTAVATDGNVGVEPTIVVDAAGGVHIVHHDAGADDLAYAFRPAGGGFVHTVVDSAGSVGRYSSAAIDADDGLHVAYYDASNDDLRYAYRPAGGDFTTATVDADGDVGRHTATVIATDGTIHILYQDAGREDLEHASRGAGGLWSLETVDTEEGVGHYASAVFDASGALQVAYHQDAVRRDAAGRIIGTDRRLLLATRPTAGAGWSTRVLDEDDFVGLHSAIAIDTAGRLHVTYWDQTHEDLRHLYRAR